MFINRHRIAYPYLGWLSWCMKFFYFFFFFKFSPIIYVLIAFIYLFKKLEKLLFLQIAFIYKHHSATSVLIWRHRDIWMRQAQICLTDIIYINQSMSVLNPILQHFFFKFLWLLQFEMNWKKNLKKEKLYMLLLHLIFCLILTLLHSLNSFK